MRGVLIQLVIAGLVGVSVAGAAPLNRARAWAEQGRTNGADRVLAGYGITNAVDRTAIVAGWDEDTFVDAALKYRAFNLLTIVMAQEKFSAANMEKIKTAVLAEKNPPEQSPEIGLKLPVAERGALKAAAGTVYARRYAEQPEFGRLWMKYRFLRDVSIYSPEVSVEDMVSLLMAVEPMAITDAESAKRAIKTRVVDMARASLRAEGKSFVMKNGVNPLVAKVQPVVDALNAPACEGLEAALRGLGATIQDVDRTELKKVSDAWRAQIMRGDVTGNEAARLLGKISVVLGSDGYNGFVDEYNNGKASRK